MEQTATAQETLLEKTGNEATVNEQLLLPEPEKKTADANTANKNLPDIISQQDDSSDTSDEASPAAEYQEDYSAYVDDFNQSAVIGEEIWGDDEAEPYSLSQEEVEEINRSELIEVNPLDYLTEEELDGSCFNNGLDQDDLEQLCEQ